MVNSNMAFFFWFSSYTSMHPIMWHLGSLVPPCQREACHNDISISMHHVAWLQTCLCSGWLPVTASLLPMLLYSSATSGAMPSQPPTSLDNEAKSKLQQVTYTLC